MLTNRLSKVLASCGVAARRACEELIFDGKVTVNGEVVLTPQTHVTLGKDKIAVNGQPVKAAEQKVYYIMNKPAGYLCSSVHEGKKIVLDLIPEEQKRLFTVGRLDRDTTGLLIITNDGHFANRVIHPSFNIQKEYLAKAEQEISEEHLKLMREGTFVEGIYVRPVRVEKVRAGTVKVVVREGKKREVRELLKKAGLSIRSLCRIRIGGLHLHTLPLGAVKKVTQQDLEKVFD